MTAEQEAQIKKLTISKQKEIELAILDNLNIEFLLLPNLSVRQMREIRLGLKSGIDVEKYADAEISALDMKNIRVEWEQKLEDQSEMTAEQETQICLDEIEKYPNFDDVEYFSNFEDFEEPHFPTSFVDSEENFDNEIKIEKQSFYTFEMTETAKIYAQDVTLHISAITNLSFEEIITLAQVKKFGGKNNEIEICKEQWESLKKAEKDISLPLTFKFEKDEITILVNIVSHLDFSAIEIEQIFLAKKSGLPIDLLLQKDPTQQHEIRLGLNKLRHNQVKLFAKSYFSAKEMREIRLAMEDGFSPTNSNDLLGECYRFYMRKALKKNMYFPYKSIFKNKIFNKEQTKILFEAWKGGLLEELEIFSSDSFDTNQMKELIKAAKKGIDIKSLSYSSYPAIQIKEIRKELEKELGIKTILKNRLKLFFRNRKKIKNRKKFLKSKK